MDQASIRQRREEAERALNRARADVKHALTDLELVRIECKHPDAFATSHTGESCRDCPDCGACEI